MKGLDIIRKLGVDPKDFYLVYSACLGSIYAIQSRFEKDILKGRKFKLNFPECELEFEDNEKYKIQYLGATNNEDIWMWGWNDKTDFPNELFDFTNQIKDFGEVYFADYARTAHFKMNKENFSNDLASTICAMFGGRCSLQAKSERGTLFVAVENVSPEIFSAIESKVFAQITMFALKNNKVNHRLFIEAFLLWNGIDYKIQNTTIVAEFDTKVEFHLIKGENDLVLEKIKIEKPNELAHEKESELIS
ncbi:MAG: hypothetical protein R3Y05_03355 [bacterium]